MSKHQELIDLWRTNSKEPSFIKWLDTEQKTCGSCKEHCGNAWCVTKEEEDDS